MKKTISKLFYKKKIDELLTLLFFMFSLLVVIFTIVIILENLEKKDEPYIDLSLCLNNKVNQIIFDKEAEKIAQKVKSQISEFEKNISEDLRDSDINILNSFPGLWFKPKDSDFLDILFKCICISKASNGLFNFTKNEDSFLKDDVLNTRFETIKKSNSFIVYDDLILDYENNRCRLNTNKKRLVFEDVIFGLVCQKIVNIYKKNNIRHAFVKIGPISVALSIPYQENSWHVNIKDSSDDLDSYVASLEIKKTKPVNFIFTIETSKNKISKLTENNISSVTIIHDDGIISSALAKVCILNNIDKNFNLLNYFGAEAVIIDKKQQIFVTSKISDDLRILDKNYTKIVIDF